MVHDSYHMICHISFSVITYKKAHLDIYIQIHTQQMILKMEQPPGFQAWRLHIPGNSVYRFDLYCNYVLLLVHKSTIHNFRTADLATAEFLKVCNQHMHHARE